MIIKIEVFKSDEIQDEYDANASYSDHTFYCKDIAEAEAALGLTARVLAKEEESLVE